MAGWKYGSQYNMPMKTALGAPKKRFEETFSAATALREHYNMASDPEAKRNNITKA